MCSRRGLEVTGRGRRHLSRSNHPIPVRLRRTANFRAELDRIEALSCRLKSGALSETDPAGIARLRGCRDKAEAGFPLWWIMPAA